MYHIELRQFPHNMCKFNMSERELFDSVVLGWAQEKWIEMGDRKWNANQAKLIVLEGPHLPLEELAMGRGWRNAERHSKDVTEQVIERARQASQPPMAPSTAPGATAGQSNAPMAPVPTTTDPAEQLRPLLGAEAAALLTAWRLTAERRPELSPSESLALAEATLSSLDAGER
jgi:hypothetical protein